MFCIIILGELLDIWMDDYDESNRSISNSRKLHILSQTQKYLSTIFLNVYTQLSLNCTHIHSRFCSFYVLYLCNFPFLKHICNCYLSRPARRVELSGGGCRRGDRAGSCRLGGGQVSWWLAHAQSLATWGRGGGRGGDLSQLLS